MFARVHWFEMFENRRLVLDRRDGDDIYPVISGSDCGQRGLCPSEGAVDHLAVDLSREIAAGSLRDSMFMVGGR